jgi:hypothetical protein
MPEPARLALTLRSAGANTALDPRLLAGWRGNNLPFVKIVPVLTAGGKAKKAKKAKRAQKNKDFFHNFTVLF